MAQPPRRALSPAEEQQFQSAFRSNPAYKQWVDSFVGQYGEQPDLDSGGYDYRSAWLHGAAPTPSQYDNGMPHWPSAVSVPPFAKPLDLKAPDHPTAWKEGYMRRFGVDPDSIDPREALARLFAPGGR